MKEIYETRSVDPEEISIAATENVNINVIMDETSDNVVDGAGPSSNGSLSNGHGSLESLGRSSKRSSLSPEKESVRERDTGTPEKDPAKSRLKERLRHLSGLDKEKLDNIPSLSPPITVGKIHDFSEYLRQNSFKTHQIIKILNESQLNPDDVLEEENGKHAIHVVCEDLNDSRLCEALIKTGHNPASQTKKGYTPLHLAILRHHHDVLKILISTASDNLNIRDENGNAPIHIAVMRQNKEAIKNLRLKKANFGQLNNKKESPLHLAAIWYRMMIELSGGNNMKNILESENIIEEIIKSLSTEELTKNLLVGEMKESPLHIFAELNQFEVIDQICQKIKDPAVFENLNNAGLTPFMICVGKGIVKRRGSPDMEDVQRHVDERRIEREQPRNVNGKRRKSSKKDKSPNQLALECAKLLLKNMTDKRVNDTNPYARNLTALQILLQNVHGKSEKFSVEKIRDLVDLLLQKGADVYLTLSDVSETPIDIVRGPNFNKDILILFIKHLKEENIDVQDDNGDTVLHYAVSINDEESIVKILEKNANVMIENRSEEYDDTDFFVTKPNMKISKVLRPRIPLMIALKNDLNDTCQTYFRALRRVGISRVVSNVKVGHHLQFYELHLIAAAFISDHQAVRELCRTLTSKGLIQKLKMSEQDVVKQVIHYNQPNHFEKTFHKTALAWANENDDPISASDLLHLEFQSHPEKSEGLSCMKKQLTNDKLLYWITRTYSKFYPTSNCIRWTTAIITSCFQLVFCGYFLYTFDIYSDYQLTTDYANAYTDVGNYTLLMLECARVSHTLEGPHANDSCFNFADKYPKRTYKVAFFLTWISMIFSLLVYLIGVIFFFNSKNLTAKFTWLHKLNSDNCDSDENMVEKIKRYSKKIFEYFLIFLIKLFWPVFHFYRRVRYEASTNKSKRRKNYIEFESIWIMVKTIENGIEATIQMIIVLYLLVPYYDEIHDWNFQTTVTKTFFGIAHFISGGRYKQACLLEKVLGKLFISVVFQGFSLTYLKYMKYGMSLPEHLTNMIPLAVSYFSQIIARLYVLRVFFVTAEDLFQMENKGLAIGTFFIIHFALTLAIKLSFEIRIEDTNGLDFHCFQSLIRFLINWISSSLVYIWSTGYGANPRKHVDEHNTFLPQMCFQLLILVEHLVLTLFPLTLSHTTCLDEHTFEFTAKLVPCLWILGNLSLFSHYKCCHTWSQTNGPTHNFSCIKTNSQSDSETEEEESEEKYKKSSLCCLPNKRYNEETDTHEPILYCISNICCSRKPYKISLHADQCLDIERVPRITDSLTVENTNGVELRPLLPENRDTSQQQLIQ